MPSSKLISELLRKELLYIIQLALQDFAIGFHHGGRHGHQHGWKIIGLSSLLIKLKNIVSRAVRIWIVPLRFQFLHGDLIVIDKGSNEETDQTTKEITFKNNEASDG